MLWTWFKSLFKVKPTENSPDPFTRAYYRLLVEGLRDMSLAELITEFDRLQAAINANDGRLSAGSSAQLDSDMDDQEEVAARIRHKLGIRGS